MSTKIKLAQKYNNNVYVCPLLLEIFENENLNHKKKNIDIKVSICNSFNQMNIAALFQLSLS